MNPPIIDIVVVDYNTGQLIRECLESIKDHPPQLGRIGRVVVVDNASLNVTAKYTKSLELPLHMIRNEWNQGFAAACNQGAAGSTADYLLFLNPDTRLCRNSLTKTISFMEEMNSQNIGILGIQLVDENGNICLSCARFPTPGRFLSKLIGLDLLFPFFPPSHFMSKSDHKKSKEVDQVMGAFFLVRRELFEFLGGFDEQYFVYFEDVDFSLRAKKAGWTSYYLADVQAYHKGQSSSKQVKAERLFYSLRSRIQYGYKHFGWLSATALMVTTLLLEPLARLVLNVVHRSGKEISETLKGYLLLWNAFPKLLKLAYQKNKV